MTRGPRRGVALAVAGILLAASCATGPRTARPGNPLRVTTVAGDTVTGEMVVARADTLILARPGVGVEALPLEAIRTVEVDRSRVRSWTRPLDCFVTGSVAVSMAYEIDEHGWSSALIPGAVLLGYLAWNCLDTRSDWKPARIESGTERGKNVQGSERSDS